MRVGEKLKIGGLTVTPQDREAYIQLENYDDGAWGELVRAGKCDDTVGMQLLAAHRIATLEEARVTASNYHSALKPAEGCSEAEGTWYETGVLDASLSIANAIEALKGDTDV